MWCRGTTAGSLTVRRSQALSPVDGRRAPGEPPGLAELMLDIRLRRASRAMTQRHLGCIGDPSKITDTPDGAPVSVHRGDHCPICGRYIKQLAHGEFREHGPQSNPCLGSRRTREDTTTLILPPLTDDQPRHDARVLPCR